MKNRLIFLITLGWVIYLLVGILQTAKAQSTDQPKTTASAWPPNTVGLHLATAHSTPGFNNVNPGVYLRWTDASGTGPVAGSYHNSERAHSAYAAYTWSWRSANSAGTANTGPVSAAITAGAITGYAAARVMLLLVPSVALHTGPAALRLTYVPKFEKRGAHALHASLEWSF